jgi:hypothetical protein
VRATFTATKKLKEPLLNRLCGRFSYPTPCTGS